MYDEELQKVVKEKPDYIDFATLYDRVKEREGRAFHITTNDHDLRTAMQELPNDDPNRPYLINLTDVIYYLSNQELYDIARHLQPGTIMVGTAHIPKYLDTSEHFIQYGQKIEGSVQLSANRLNAFAQDYQLRDVTMTMKMNGNDTPYIHSLNYMQYLHSDMTSDFIINTAAIDDFVLKVVPIEKYDSGATDYVRFKIIKLQNPTAEELIIDHFRNYFTGSILTRFRAELTRQGHERLPYPAIINDMKQTLEDYGFHYPSRIRNTDGKITDQKLGRKLFSTRIGKTNGFTTDSVIAKHPENIENYNKEVFLKDGYYYFTKTVTDLNKRIHKIRIQIKDQKEQIAQITSVASPELINRLVNKITLMDKLDTRNLKALITYINTQEPKYNIPNQVIPLLAEVISQTLTTETQLNSLLNSSLVQTLNSVKNGEFKIEKYETKTLTIWQRIKQALFHIYTTNIEEKAETTLHPFQSRPQGSHP